MIAPSSLSAFTPSVQSSGPVARVAASTAARAEAPGSVQKPLQALPSGTGPSSRGTPRGSLLDLSV